MATAHTSKAGETARKEFEPENDKDDKPKANGANGATLPGEGWTQGEQERPDGFWLVKEGARVHFTGLEVKTKPDDQDPKKMRTYYIVRLLARTEVTLPKKPGEDKGRTAVLGPGKIIQVDERNNITGIGRMIQENGREANQFVIEVKAKRKIPGTKKSVWDMEWYHKEHDAADDFER